MTINYHNKANVDLICVHDMHLTEFTYDYKNSSIRFQGTSIDPDSKYYINFYNVFGFKVLCCDWWGKSQRVVDWELVEECENSFTKEILEFRSSEKSTFPRLIKEEDAVETRFIFASGDTIIIVCESIDFIIE